MRIRIRILPFNLMRIRIHNMAYLCKDIYRMVLLYVQYKLTVAYLEFYRGGRNFLFIYWHSHDIRKLRTFSDEYLCKKWQQRFCCIDNKNSELSSPSRVDKKMTV